MADVDPAIPVVFLDTGWLFEETLAYRDTLIASARSYRRALDHAAGRDACRARIRTAICGSPIPMPAAASARWSRWRGRCRRSTAGSMAASVSRAATAPPFPLSKHDGAQAEVQSARQCRRARRSRRSTRSRTCRRIRWSHPASLSVGCMPCSSRTLPGEDARAGRWRGRGKTECGIHTTKTS